MSGLANDCTSRKAAYSIAVLAAIIITIALAAAVRPKKRSRFYPRLRSPCAAGRPFEGGEEAIDPWNRGGTVVSYPYSTQSRVSLERGAETPEVAETVLGANPITGLGLTSRVRAWGDRLQDAACRRDGMFDLKPGEPGYLVPTTDDDSVRACTYKNPEYCTDGPFGDAVLETNTALSTCSGCGGQKNKYSDWR